MDALDDTQIQERLDALAVLSTAQLAERYTPDTVARIARHMAIEMQLRRLPQADALPADFAFRVAERVGVVEAGSSTGEKVAAGASIALVTGSGVGTVAWLSRLGDAADLFSFATGIELGFSLMPIVGGAAAIGFYVFADRYLKRWMADRQA